jgi:hypothetical protein
MASKALYTVVAVVGIAAASGAAWWYQNKPAKPAETQQAGGSAGPGRPVAGGAGSGPGAAGGPGRAPAVEVAKVQVMKLVDDAQAVGSLRSRQGVVLRPEVSGRITQLNFRDGDRVRKGQLLVQLDDQLPLAQVQQARPSCPLRRPTTSATRSWWHKTSSASARWTKAPPTWRWPRPSWRWHRPQPRACVSWRRLTASPASAASTWATT